MISIICPTYNCAEDIEMLLNSVFCQTCRDYELIVVDGGSTDGTIDKLRKRKKRLRYVSEPDDGIYDAMNKGIAMAKGEWLYFIGADDMLFMPDTLRELSAFLDDSVDVVLCNIMMPGLSCGTSRFSWRTFFHNTIHHQGAVYHRRVFDKYKYDTSLKIMADYDLNLYLFFHGCRFGYADMFLAHHTPYGVSGQPHLLNYKEEIAVRNRYLHNRLAQLLLAGFSYAKYIYKNIRHMLTHPSK